VSAPGGFPVEGVSLQVKNDFSRIQGVNMIAIHWGLLVVAILLCQVIGIAGALFTAKAVPTWYRTLKKPTFQPPPWLFGPVWTILYTLMGISLWRLWILPLGTPGRTLALVLFAIQLILNALWTPVFFGLHKPWMAFGVILALCIAIFACLFSFMPLDPWASYLLVPYLLWVGFASVLNYSVAKLN
jgi:translocator protein